jgi:hypothetical protein
MNERTSTTPVGTQINDYTVIEELGSEVMVQCACGSSPRKMRRNYLVTGRVKGCMECRWTRRPKAVNAPRWASQQVFGSYQCSAEKRGIPMEITLDEFRELIVKNCHYCDSPPSNVKVVGKENVEFWYNGIDRVDSSKSYNLDNLVPACRFCNYAKRERTTEEFMSWIDRLVRKYGNSSQL